MENTFLLKSFDALNQAAINYCLLRGSDELEISDGDREIDLLVAPDHRSRLANVLAAEGFVMLPSWGYAPHHFFVAYDRTNGGWLKFDVVTDLCYGKPMRALRIDRAEDCLRNRRRHGPTYVLSAENEFMTLFLHCLLDKANFRDIRGARLLELRNQIVSDQIVERLLVQQVERYLKPTLDWHTLMNAIANQDWSALIKQRAAVARQLFWRDPLMSAWRHLSVRLLRRLRPLLFAVRRRGLSVALLAPDGAGKTTLAKELTRDAFLQAQLIYTGTNIENGATSLPTSQWLHQRLKSLNGKPGKMSLRRIVLKGLHFGNRLVEQWYRLGVAVYHKRRGRFVIFDRYAYDSWLAKRGTTPWKRFRRWLLGLGWSTPDLVILLNAPGELLYQRKREHSPEWLEQQRQAYLGLKDRIPQMIVVDATAEPNEVQREVTSLIWNHYRLRTNPILFNVKSLQKKQKLSSRLVGTETQRIRKGFSLRSFAP